MFFKYFKNSIANSKQFEPIVHGPSEPANAQNLSPAAASFLYSFVIHYRFTVLQQVNEKYVKVYLL